MIGAIVGDVVGSVYEWRNHRSKEFPLFHPNAFFTDDSLCTIAVADCLLMGAAPGEIRRHLSTTYGYDMARTVDSIRPGYEFDESCQGTVPEAIICALEASGFEDALRNAISIGGDSDTVACIAGGVAEARFGVPGEIAEAGLGRLTSELRDIVEKMYAKRVDPTLPSAAQGMRR